MSRNITIGTQVSFVLGLGGEGRSKGVTTSECYRDDQGRWGYDVKTQGFRKLFVYTPGIKVVTVTKPEVTVEQKLAIEVNKAFRGTGITEHGRPYRGGYSLVTLKPTKLTASQVSKTMRKAVKAAGFRAQSGCWNTHMNNPDAREFYVIRGTYNNGKLACIALEGTAAAPRINIAFGG